MMPSPLPKYQEKWRDERGGGGGECYPSPVPENKENEWFERCASLLTKDKYVLRMDEERNR